MIHTLPDGDENWLAPLVAMATLDQPPGHNDLWDELRDQCRILGESEGGEEAWLARGIRDLLDQLEAAGELHAHG
jgi:hypothetical protein